MSESLESISVRPVGPLTSSAPVAGYGGAARNGRGRETGAFSLPDRADQNDDGARLSGANLTDRLSLSPEAQQQLRELKQRDAEVRAHERAHMAAGGAHVTGGPEYVYQKGPDGRQYAIGGHVSIDASSVPGDPEARKRPGRCVGRLWRRESPPGRIVRWRPAPPPRKPAPNGISGKRKRKRAGRRPHPAASLACPLPPGQKALLALSLPLTPHGKTAPPRWPGSSLRRTIRPRR